MNQIKDDLLVLAKMALQDGVLDPSELAFLKAMSNAIPEGDLEALIDEAHQHDLDELSETVETYADRFVIALRAYAIALADEHYDIEEEAFFGRLVHALGISVDDRALIETAVAALESDEPEAPPPRLVELFSESTFLPFLS